MKYPAQSDIWQLQSQVLARFQQVFPLTLFPDELIIEKLRIVWVQKNGPWANNVISIMAEDIASVNAATGPFFGHVSIKSLTGKPEILLEHLLRSDASKIASLVEEIALGAREGTKIENLLHAGSLRLA